MDEQPADPNIADKLARMNLAGKISQTKAGCRTLLGIPPKPKRTLAKPGEKFEVNTVEEKNGVAGKTLSRKPSRPAPGSAAPSPPVEDRPPVAEVVKGTEIVAQARRAIQEARQRRAQAVEALTKGPGGERDLNKAILAEEDAALAFHNAAATYGQAMIDAHRDAVPSTEQSRTLTRLQAETALKRKKYDQARLQTQAARTAG